MTPSVFGMPMSNSNALYNDKLGFNLNQISNEIDVSIFQSKKHYEHVSLACMLKVFQRLISHRRLRLLAICIK